MDQQQANISPTIDGILAHNRAFVERREFERYATDKYPDKKLAIVSCMDTRLTALLLAGMFMATRTAFGRRIYAIGGNLEAARLSGISVERTKLAVFAINGLMVAIAGLILSSRLGAGSPSAGNIAELDAIAACVIGGTSLAGGIGSVAGAVMGAFIMSALDNGMSMMDVATFWQYIVKGVILLLAVWMDSATKRRN